MIDKSEVVEGGKYRMDWDYVKIVKAISQPDENGRIVLALQDEGMLGDGWHPSTLEDFCANVKERVS